MRSEDRKPSKRVFPLLQNLDLDSVTFAQVQGVGDPITIEDMNEQEMVDLIIVNLARLTCVSEWDGLLTAGGGEQYALTPIDASLLPATYTRFSPMDVYRMQSTTVASTSVEDKAMFERFVAPKTGTIGQITVRTSATNTGKDNLLIAVYTTSGGLPTTRIGNISIDINGSADLYTSSSWSTAPPLVIGQTYWIGFVAAAATVPIISMAVQTQFLALGLTHYPGTGYSTLYNNTGTDFDLPSTVDLDLVLPKTDLLMPVWSYKYA